MGTYVAKSAPDVVPFLFVLSCGSLSLTEPGQSRASPQRAGPLFCAPWSSATGGAPLPSQLLQPLSHVPAQRRVQGGQFVEQCRGSLLTVCDGSSRLPAPPTRDANSSAPMPGPEAAAGGDSVSRQDRNGASARQRLGKVGRQSEGARCPALSGDRRRRPEPIWSSAPTCFPNFRVVTSTGGPRCCTRRCAQWLYDGRVDDLPRAD